MLQENSKKRLIVLSSPSGGGKSTVARFLLNNFRNLKFSISATTRSMRPREKHGKEYFFISRDDFQKKINSNELVEYEEIFGNFYGTLRSEIEKSFSNNECLLFDIDVKGALSIRKAYPEDSLLIFLSPPDLNALEERLRKRHTESEEQIQTRLSRASMEMSFKDEFDFVVVNEILDFTLEKVKSIVSRCIT